MPLRFSCAVSLTFFAHDVQSSKSASGCHCFKLRLFCVMFDLVPHCIFVDNSTHTGLWSVAACVFWSIQVTWRNQSCDARIKSICASCPSLHASRVYINSERCVFCQVLHAINPCSAMNSTNSPCLSYSCAERDLLNLSAAASPIKSWSHTPARLTLHSKQNGPFRALLQESFDF